MNKSKLKSVILLHIILIGLAIVFGLFANSDDPVTEMQSLRLLALLPLAAALAVLILGTASLITKRKWVSTLFWFLYLCSVFSIFFGLVYAARTIFFGLEDFTSLQIVSGSLGYFLGLYLVAKIYHWRHGKLP